MNMKVALIVKSGKEWFLRLVDYTNFSNVFETKGPFPISAMAREAGYDWIISAKAQVMAYEDQE